MKHIARFGRHEVNLHGMLASAPLRIVECEEQKKTSVKTCTDQDLHQIYPCAVAKRLTGNCGCFHNAEWYLQKEKQREAGRRMLP